MANLWALCWLPARPKTWTILVFVSLCICLILCDTSGWMSKVPIWLALDNVDILTLMLYTWTILLYYTVIFIHLIKRLRSQSSNTMSRVIVFNVSITFGTRHGALSTERNNSLNEEPGVCCEHHRYNLKINQKIIG